MYWVVIVTLSVIAGGSLYVTQNTFKEVASLKLTLDTAGKSTAGSHPLPVTWQLLYVAWAVQTSTDSASFAESQRRGLSEQIGLHKQRLEQAETKVSKFSRAKVFCSRLTRYSPKGTFVTG